jgi:ferredoxin
MKVKRKIIEINEELCDGCGLCVPSCAEGAIQILDGKAKLITDKFCDGLGACLGECPNGALKVTEREAEDFDPEAVETHLKNQEKTPPQPEPALACGCPSTQVQTFLGPLGGSKTQPLDSTRPAPAGSTLAHWPVQIKLVPAKAPFLKDAELLVLADCVPVAYPHLHRDFLPGKSVLMGCPKLDAVEDYIQKFTDMFKTNNIRNITVAYMEVPCCSGLPRILELAMKEAGKNIPLRQVVVSTRGEILSWGD